MSYSTLGEHLIIAIGLSIGIGLGWVLGRLIAGTASAYFGLWAPILVIPLYLLLAHWVPAIRNTMSDAVDYISNQSN